VSEVEDSEELRSFRCHLSDRSMRRRALAATCLSHGVCGSSYTGPLQIDETEISCNVMFKVLSFRGSPNSCVFSHSA